MSFMLLSACDSARVSAAAGSPEDSPAGGRDRGIFATSLTVVGGSFLPQKYNNENLHFLINPIG